MLSPNNDLINQFVARLIEEKKMSNLDPEILEQAKQDLIEKAEDSIKAAIFENLPADKMEEFVQLLESGDANVLQSFVKEALPDLESVIAKALLNFRHSYLG